MESSRKPDWLERGFALTGLTLLLFLNVVLPSWSVGGYPIRGLFAVVLLVLLAVFYGERFLGVIQKYMAVVILAIGLAALGIFVSILNGAAADAIVETLLEVHLQAVVTLLLAGIVADICGPKACVAALVGVIGLSAIVAMLQFLGVEAAWNLRVALGQMQYQALELNALDARPRGLSYSPVQLSTQLCVAFAAYAAWLDNRRGQRTADPRIFIAMLAFTAVCVATGTRSPILGAIVFFGFYTIARRGSWVPLMVLAVGAVLYLAWPTIMSALQTAQPRIARIDDGSAAGRSTMIYYGWRLFLDSPLGYGLAFKPFELWPQYWHELYMLPGPGGVRVNELHNYPMTLLNTYGIGLLLFIPFVGSILFRNRASLLFFVPYILHIAFHNAGPFWNDNLIWFAIAAIATMPMAAATTADCTRNVRFRVSSTDAPHGLKPTVGLLSPGSPQQTADATRLGGRRRYGT